MGFIYKITNDINDKVYIGQTIFTVQQRWNKHLVDSKDSNYHIHMAMKKYGIEHFKCEIIEECDNSKLDEREIYWIDCYDSFNNGYNSTLGGQGIHTRDYSEVYELWETGYSVQDISLFTNIPYSTLCIVIKNKYDDYKERSRKYKSAIMMGAPVSRYSMNGDYIDSFISISVASEETGIYSSAIHRCCNGLDNHAGKYQWRYGDSKDNIGAGIISHTYGYRVDQYTKDMVYITTYESYKDAERKTGVANSAISACCLGRRKSAGGYIWKRSEQYE